MENVIDIATRLGPTLAARAAAHDREGSFVHDNYSDLKRERLFSAAVPADLGGGGASHAEICALIRELALYCPSTALSLSMHTHLVATAVWRHLHGQPAEALLRAVAEGEKVLVSTGANDWLESVGMATKVDGGYRVSAKKRFASGSPAGDLAITSAPCDHPTQGPVVIHFAQPLSAPGVRLDNDWDTMGMRATGSNTLVFDDVFVPDSAVSVIRPRGQWHPSFHVICTVAIPIFMSAYVGVAHAAGRAARSAAEPRAKDPLVQRAVGELETALFTIDVAMARVVENARNYDFAPDAARANVALMGKSVMANAVRTAVNKAVEVSGGSAFYRKSPIERLWRDAQGVQFHPLPEGRQLLATGRIALGLPPE